MNEVQNKQERSYFFAIGSMVLLIIDLGYIFVLGEYALLNILVPITFAFLITTIPALVLKRSAPKTKTILTLIFVAATVVGFMLVAAVGGFYM